MICGRGILPKGFGSDLKRSMMKRFFLMLLASCALSVFAETEIVNDITWSYQVSGEGKVAKVCRLHCDGNGL